MNIHQDARLTPLGRERLVRLIESGASCASAAASCGVSPKTAAKWWRRFRSEGAGGLRGLRDRSWRPHSLRGLTPTPCARARSAFSNVPM